MKKTLLEIFLFAQYYKKDITDRYYIKNNSLIITNEAIKKLDKPHKEKLYIDTWSKTIEKDNEIERLTKLLEEKTNIIEELEKWLQENIKISKAHDNQLGVNVCNTFLDKLKELKEGK